mmetsp:Transcript_17629/g.19137  ORF Transcript_17629/g.19137 Transcript_17629/m.19137 type:complete len:269 (+) Transcript_17629:195-1001(+)
MVAAKHTRLKPSLQVEMKRLHRLNPKKFNHYKLSAKFNVPRTTIRDFLKRSEISGGGAKPGRPRKLSPRDERHVIRLAANTKRSQQSIANALPVKVSRRTIGRILHRCPFIRRSKLRIHPEMKPEDPEKRRLFARKYHHWGNKWRKTFFLDEKKFNLDGPDGDRGYWRGIRTPPKAFCKRVAGGGSVNIWLGINFYQKLDLMFIKGANNSIQYTDILERALFEKVYARFARGFNLLHDGSSIHTSHFTETIYLRRTCMFWTGPRVPLT